VREERPPPSVDVNAMTIRPLHPSNFPTAARRCAGFGREK
jgi:hypothetical protein